MTEGKKRKTGVDIVLIEYNGIRMFVYIKGIDINIILSM